MMTFNELAKARLLPLKILQVATLDLARYLGCTGTMGTVAAGKGYLK
jgi:hypothetical protein